MIALIDKLNVGVLYSKKIEKKERDCTILFSQLFRVIESGWFFSYTTKEQAADLLSRSSPGTFLVRFGSSPAPCFAITKVTSEHKIIHIRVNKDPVTRKWNTRDGVFASLKELIDKSKQLHLKRTVDQDKEEAPAETHRSHPLAFLVFDTHESPSVRNSRSNNYYIADPDDFKNVNECYHLH